MTAEIPVVYVALVGTWWISGAWWHHTSIAERVVVDTCCRHADKTEKCRYWWRADGRQHPCCVWQVWTSGSSVSSGAWLSSSMCVYFVTFWQLYWLIFTDKFIFSFTVC